MNIRESFSAANIAFWTFVIVMFGFGMYASWASNHASDDSEYRDYVKPASYTSYTSHSGYADYDVDSDIEEDDVEETVEMEEVCSSMGKWGARCKMTPVDRPWYDSGAPGLFSADSYRKY